MPARLPATLCYCVYAPSVVIARVYSAGDACECERERERERDAQECLMMTRWPLLAPSPDAPHTLSASSRLRAP